MLFIKQTIALFLVIVFGYYLYTFAINQQKVEGKLTPNPDGTIGFSGKVISNKTECEKDRCFLLVKNSEGTTAFVIYNLGDNAFCGNEIAATRGRSMAPGNNVKVFGYYEFENNQDTIRTCSKSSYYIETL